MLRSVASMVLNSEEANRMQSAVETVFACLPKGLKTEEVKIEIAKSVVSSGGNYQKAARDSVMVIFRRQRAVTIKGWDEKELDRSSSSEQSRD